MSKNYRLALYAVASTLFIFSCNPEEVKNSPESTTELKFDGSEGSFITQERTAALINHFKTEYPDQPESVLTAANDLNTLLSTPESMGDKILLWIKLV